MAFNFERSSLSEQNSAVEQFKRQAFHQVEQYVSNMVGTSLSRESARKVIEKAKYDLERAEVVSFSHVGVNPYALAVWSTELNKKGEGKMYINLDTLDWLLDRPGYMLEALVHESLHAATGSYPEGITQYMAREIAGGDIPAYAEEVMRVDNFLRQTGLHPNEIFGIWVANAPQNSQEQIEGGDAARHKAIIKGLVEVVFMKELDRGREFANEAEALRWIKELLKFINLSFDSLFLLAGGIEDKPDALAFECLAQVAATYKERAQLESQRRVA